tara:strand:+ start:17476 stop:18396 length:921 start_codon:yes stop_codon:yes gene_type:complete
MGIDPQAKLLVIGGTGFIGSAIVEYAIGLGWLVDSLGLSLPSAEKKKSGVSYLVADITTCSTLKIIDSRSYDYIVNTGGYIDHSHFCNGGDKLVEAHFNGVVNLVKSIDRANLKRFINIGSSDEYGDNPAPQSESDREKPISPYSAGKAAATQFLQMLFRTEKFPAVTLRLFLCYGPGQDRMRFLPHLISRCITNDDIEISPGEQLRDYCFIEDVVEAVFLTMFCDDANGRVFNIASGEPISIKQVVKKVVAIVGTGVPKFGAMPYRYGESMELYADVALAKNILSWNAKTTLAEGLSKTITHYAS